MPRHFEDFAIGDRFRSATATITQDDIVAFARQFDPQPFHTDPVAAPSLFFGGLVASGWHTAAVTMRLLVQGELDIAGGLIGAGGEIAWPVPVRAGDVLHVVSEVVEVVPSRSHPERGSVLVRSETRNQDDVVVQRFTARLIVPRRPA